MTEQRYNYYKLEKGRKKDISIYLYIYIYNGCYKVEKAVKAKHFQPTHCLLSIKDKSKVRGEF